MSKIFPVQSGILLFAKRSGITSFSSLYIIKNALKTSKVGHTGTLDKFACGLLVVCTGTLTRISSRITEFDKIYEANISFGIETDTLDSEGTVLKTAECPLFSDFEKALADFRGVMLQIPPVYSACHIKGRRASDIARSGAMVSLPARKIEVFSSTIMSVHNAGDGKIDSALVLFHVSKGTYIRSLARDIGVACGSVAHLTALKRTQVGDFKLSDAVGFEKMESMLDNGQYNEYVQCQIPSGLQYMTFALAEKCGFIPLVIDEIYLNDFYNGRVLKPSMFRHYVKKNCNTQYAVFTENEVFIGAVECCNEHLKYGFVIPR